MEKEIYYCEFCEGKNPASFYGDTCFEHKYYMCNRHYAYFGENESQMINEEPIKLLEHYYETTRI
jgi:hypothetical protein